MDRKGQNEWGVKLKFWTSMVDKREELYEDVGLGHLRGEQGGRDTRIRAGKNDNFENQSEWLGFLIIHTYRNQLTALA